MNFLRTQKTLSLALVLIAAAVFADSAAAGPWRAAHPRRAQVNDRLLRQDVRIARQVRQGDLSPAQAAELRREHRLIRQEARAMAGSGGHISRQEQRILNRQLNGVSRRIGR